MKSKNTVIAVLVVIVAVIGAALLMDRNKESSDMGNMNKSTQMSSNSETVKPDTSSVDYKMMAAVNGEEYDRLFLANMIEHHQGAVDMAKLVLTSTTKHEEIKDLAQAIVNAQTKEIGDMTNWQTSWGYPASSGAAMMDHSAMGMMDTNAGMMNALKGKSGDAFDKAFLEQMIIHHQSAIDMAASGSNAEHQEIKDLTKAIVSDQTKEIQKMRTWQKDWGYIN